MAGLIWIKSLPSAYALSSLRIRMCFPWARALSFFFLCFSFFFLFLFVSFFLKSLFHFLACHFFLLLLLLLLLLKITPQAVASAAPELFNLAQEVLFTAQLDNKKRIVEMLKVGGVL